MKKKRIIPCLDVKEGRTVKGVHFLGLKDAGDPVELVKKYSDQGADELVFLDITATVEGRTATWEMVEKTAARVDIPFTMGGGISTVEDVGEALDHGVDKVVINSAVVRQPDLIDQVARKYGSSRLVVGIDARPDENDWWVYVSGGRTKSTNRLVDWAKEVESRGAGEILFTSMEHDGTKAGFALEILQRLKSTVGIPLIASGGAGKKEDFLELFQQNAADAGLAASIFHYDEVSIPELKKYLRNHGISFEN